MDSDKWKLNQKWRNYKNRQRIYNEENAEFMRSVKLAQQQEKEEPVLYYSIDGGGITVTGDWEDVEFYNKELAAGRMKLTSYKIGVDVAPKGSNDYTVIMIDGLQIVGENPEFCEHEWWEDTVSTYTTSPPVKRWVCRLCGMERFVQTNMTPQSFRWKKV